MKRLLLFITIALVAFSELHAYYSLRILNPSSWGSDQGVIKTADLYVQPKGLYVQYDFVLEFSAQHTYFLNSDSLEVEMHFELPEGAIVNDSWLLIGDSIVSADLIDRWTASAIYEGIVQRRKDPSVLYKNSPTSYELRIFPITKGENRIAGISYLFPVQWDAASIHAELPINLLNAAKNDVNLNVFFPKDYDKEISIAGKSFDLDQYNHEYFGSVTGGDLRSRDYHHNVALSMPSPMKNGVYFNKTEYKGEGYYQLAMLPSALMDFTNKKKIAILLDYDISKTTISKAELVKQVKNQLYSYTPTDSFMLFYSDVTAKMLQDHWISCDSAGIERTLDGLADKIGNYSALPSLLSSGTAFMNEVDNGRILLVGSSDQAGHFEIANSIMEDLNEITDNLPTFYIADVANENVSYHYQGGKHYFGNEYLYILLTRKTKGKLIKYIDRGSLLETISETFQATSGLINTIDLYTSLEDGFCYGRYFNINVDQGIYVNQPLTQIGKYIGEFPFEINLSGIYNDEAFSVKKTINEQEAKSADSAVSKCWSGRFIGVLEKQSGNTETIHEIIKHSMEHRILSKYTAFLALEPGMEVDFDEEQEDDEFLIDIEDVDIEVEHINLKAYPNPFVDKLTIQFRVPENIESDQVIIHIYNLMGQVIKKIILPKGLDGREFNYKWDKSDTSGATIPAGQYMVVITGPGFKKTTMVISQ